MTTNRNTCPVCDDDGWLEVVDYATGDVVTTRECPHLHNPGHAPFNATGVLGDLEERS